MGLGCKRKDALSEDARLRWQSCRPVSIQVSQSRAAGLGVMLERDEIRLADLRALTEMAYRVDIDHLSGPDWMTRSRFDIAAVMPQGATKEQFPGMFAVVTRGSVQVSGA